MIQWYWLPIVLIVGEAIGFIVSAILVAYKPKNKYFKR